MYTLLLQWVGHNLELSCPKLFVKDLSAKYENVQFEMELCVKVLEAPHMFRGLIRGLHELYKTFVPRSVA